MLGVVFSFLMFVALLHVVFVTSYKETREK